MQTARQHYRTDQQRTNDMRHGLTKQVRRHGAVMAINLDAAFFAAQACAHLARRGGDSIITSAQCALLGPSNMPGYVSAKQA